MSAVCAIEAIATKNTMIDVIIFFISFCSLVQDSVYGLHKPVELISLPALSVYVILACPPFCALENRLPIVLKYSWSARAFLSDLFSYTHSRNISAI